MPLPTFARTRTRPRPNLGGSNVILGKMFPAILVNGVPTGQYNSVPSNTYVFDYATGARWETLQVTRDNTHPGPPYLSGGDFSSLKYEWCTPYIGVFGSGVFDRIDKMQRYVGGFHPPMSAGAFCPSGTQDRFSFSNNSDLWLTRTVDNTNLPSMAGLGDRAWQSTKPKIEKADGAVFGAELRDMPRMLESTGKRFHQIWKAMGGYYTSKSEVAKGGIRLMRPKKVADDFLSQQFGWMPFLRDLVKFNNVVMNYHDIIASSVAKNNRWVRRRVTLEAFEESKIIKTEMNNQCHPVLLNQSFFRAPASNTVSELKTTQITAVGKFRYYRPEFDVSVQDNISQWNQAMQFITVSGLRPSPSNLYQAVPWTWLIDWFANVGDYIDHLNDVWIDSVVGQYCFVMQHEIIERTLVQELPFQSSDRTLRFTRKIESKQRNTGNSPYGFGLTWDQLSPRQIAIAIALGVKRP